MKSLAKAFLDLAEVLELATFANPDDEKLARGIVSGFFDECSDEDKAALALVASARADSSVTAELESKASSFKNDIAEELTAAMERSRLTLFSLLHCHDGSSSVWLVPGSTRDRDDGPLDDLLITEYLDKRGLLLGRVQAAEDDRIIIDECRSKLVAKGFEVDIETGADD